MYRSRLGICLVGTFIIIITLATGTLWASAPQGDSTHVLRDVVVTERWLAREVVPAQRLSGQSLRRLNSVSIGDALRYFSGVQIKDYGGIGGLKTVNIRSMGSQHVGVFYDGVRIGNAQNGQVDLSRFSLDNMEAIAIYNGQKSSLLQPATHYASSSSVYMQTRRPEVNKENPQRLLLTARMGSFATLNPSVLYERRLSSALNLSLSGEYLYTSGEYPYRYSKQGGYDTTAVRRNGDVHALRLETGLYGGIERGAWQFKTYLYQSERGYPGAVVRELPGVLRHEDRQWDTNTFVQASWRKSWEVYSLLLNAKYAYDYLHYLSDPRRDVSTMYVNNHYHQQELYFSQAHQWQILPWWRLSLASDVQLNTLEADLYRFAYPRRLSLLHALATSVDWSPLKVQASLLHSYYRDWTKASSSSAPERSIFTPSLVLSYRPSAWNGLSLRGFYKSIFRMPTFNDLYYTFIGSKDLLPERTHQYDLGFSFARSYHQGLVRTWEIEGDFYFNKVENKIIAMPTSNQFQWSMVNLGQVDILGAEMRARLQAQWRDFSITGLLSYTYQKSVDVTDKNSSYYRGQIAYIPWHSVSAVVNVDWHGWGLNYSFIYTGERYDSSANIRENYIQPWYTHDVSLVKAFRLWGQSFRATVEINNLLNQQYEVVRSYPMPGINMKAKLEWNL